MREVMAGLFHSVDGVVEGPDKWQFDAFDDELGAELGNVIEDTDTVLMGRRGYEEWASYWPTAQTDEGFGGFINAVPKHVASRTLTSEQITWQNATLIPGALADFVADLKRREGGGIAAMGGITIVRELLFAGLLDRLTLITHPVVAGTGRHLFQDGDDLTRLILLDSYRTSKGNVVTSYGRRPA